MRLCHYTVLRAAMMYAKPQLLTPCYTQAVPHLQNLQIRRIRH